LFDDVLKAPTTIAKAEAKTGKSLDKKIGGALVYGHQHPFDAFMDVMQAPQRGLQALETGQNVGHAIMSPGEEPRLSKAVKTKIGLQGLEDNGFLKGNDLGHKVLRGVADTGLDIVNDPMTFLPVGKGLEWAGKGVKALPGAEKALGAAGHAIAESPLGQGASHLFNPDHYMRGLTPEAKAAFEQATNQGMEAVKARKLIEDAIVKKHAAAIRAGEMPTEVRNLFTAPKHGTIEQTLEKYFPEGMKKGMRPQEVQGALFLNRAPQFKTEVMDRLKADTPDFKSAGIFDDPNAWATTTRGKPSPFTTADAKEIEEIQKRLERAIEQKSEEGNPIISGARAIMHRGNQAFLANPVPHTFNLTNLAYNRYGLPTAAKGLVNAGRVAIGKTGGRLGENIRALDEGGAKSQYGNLFDELGLTRIPVIPGLPGIPGTEGAARLVNKALIPMQRAANYAQDKVLNSTETGLRAAALDAERKGGTTGPQAMKNIHAAFGTDAPNEITRGGQKLATPFAKFHLQTVPGSTLRTLAKNPARVVNSVKGDQDYNKQVNPHGPQYRSSVPSMSGVRMFADPLHYFDNFGPISKLSDPYGPLALAQKGKVGQALGGIAQKYTPGSEELAALIEMLRKKKGNAKESGLQDLFASGVGGYYVKK
jgi:hypothetical protein